MHILAKMCIPYSTFARRTCESAVKYANSCAFLHTVLHFCDVDLQKCCKVCKFQRICAHSTALLRCARLGFGLHETPHLSIRIASESTLACILSTSTLQNDIHVDRNRYRERSCLHSEHFDFTKRRTCRSGSMPRALSPAF